MQGLLFFPALHAGGGFFIQRARYRRRATRGRQARHGDFELFRPTEDIQSVAHTYFVGWLATVAIEPDVPGEHGFCSERTRLEEARRLQPFVDT